jgi:hypothetical protein
VIPAKLKQERRFRTYSSQIIKNNGKSNGGKQGCIKYQSGPKTVCLYTVTTLSSQKHQANHGIARLP